MLEGTKKQWQSTTIINAAVLIIAAIGKLFDIAIDQAQWADLLSNGWLAVMAIVTGIGAWKGRLDATQKVE
ncbi:MAG: hypothetical protein KDJ39_05915 [Gammaproteobacteria bacterium]|nr:hypothetical protein [Gammaproteobacteria bacterium]